MTALDPAPPLPGYAASAMPDPARLWTPRGLPANPMGWRLVDLFCGAGGSSLGMTAAGYELALGANHWKRAVATHEANFLDAEHLAVNINHYDMRNLPPAEILWASPICIEVSPSGGNGTPKRQRKAEKDLFDDEDDRPLDDEAYERTRATCYDVIRATEVWDYKVVIVENVVELAWKWKLFPNWLGMMHTLGYDHQITCLNAAHVEGEDNPATASWRDRMFIVFTKQCAPKPDLEPTPWAWCDECGENVQARRVWKDTPRVREFAHLGMIGKYRSQYVYVCPRVRKHANPVVEPYVRPAVSAIDMTDLGPRICDRDDPLRPNTWNKILRALDLVRTGATMMTVTHGHHDGRMYRPWDRPLETRTSKIGDGMVAPEWFSEFVVELRGGGSLGRSAYHPLSTLTSSDGGRHHGLVTTGTVASWEDHRLVIPYRKGNPTTTAGLLRPDASEVDPKMLHYRMLKPFEHARAMRFHPEYEITGTGAEVTIQAGNAVAPNCAYFIGKRVREAYAYTN